MGLARLAPLVAKACGLHQVNPTVLRRFLVAQGIELPSSRRRSALKKREAEAREAMVSWFDRDQLLKALPQAIDAALAWCLRSPMSEEFYDPEHPEEWFVAEELARNLAEFLSLEVFKQAQSVAVSTAKSRGACA